MFPWSSLTACPCFHLLWAKNVCPGAQPCAPIYSRWSCDKLTIFLKIWMTWSLEKIVSKDFPVFLISASVAPQWFHHSYSLALNQQQLSQSSGIWVVLHILLIAAQQMHNTCNFKIYQTFISMWLALELLIFLCISIKVWLDAVLTLL